MEVEEWVCSVVPWANAVVAVVVVVVGVDAADALDPDSSAVACWAVVAVSVVDGCRLRSSNSGTLEVEFSATDVSKAFLFCAMMVGETARIIYRILKVATWNQRKRCRRCCRIISVVVFAAKKSLIEVCVRTGVKRSSDSVPVINSFSFLL